MVVEQPAETPSNRPTRTSAASLVAAAHTTQQRMADPAELGAITDKLLAAVADWSADAVVGASPDGDRLAGAVALRSAGGLRLWSPSIERARVLLVDTLLVTGSQLDRAARRVREAGAVVAGGVAVVGEPAAVSVMRTRLDTNVAALEPLSEG